MPSKKPNKPHTKPKKLMGKSRPTVLVRWITAKLPGRGMKKVENIAEKTIRQLGHDQFGKYKKESILRLGAHKSLKKSRSVGYLHCADRCNLAISMMRSAGVSTWLVRQMEFNAMGNRWDFHDYVEFFMNGKVHTLFFGEAPGEGAYYDIKDKPAHKLFSGSLSYFFRGADSGQIGGVTNYGKFKKFANRLEKMPSKEVLKEVNRQDLLVKSGIIPKQAMEQIRG